jgi:hypothetical protein
MLASTLSKVLLPFAIGIHARLVPHVLDDDAGVGCSHGYPYKRGYEHANKGKGVESLPLDVR